MSEHSKPEKRIEEILEEVREETREGIRELVDSFLEGLHEDIEGLQRDISRGNLDQFMSALRGSVSALIRAQRLKAKYRSSTSNVKGSHT